MGIVSKIMTVATSLLLTWILPAALVFAESPSSLGEHEMSKDDWLAILIPGSPAAICSDFMQDPILKKRFDTLHITYEQCLSAIPSIAKSCQDQLYEQIPQIINKDNATTWGGTIGACIGKEYESRYLAQ